MSAWVTTMETGIMEVEEMVLGLACGHREGDWVSKQAAVCQKTVPS